MTVRGYLDQVKRYKHNIEALEAAIKRLREDTAGVSAIDYSRDRVQTSPSGNRTEIMLERIIEREAEMDKLIVQYKYAIGVITHQITQMETDNPYYIDILYKVYIDFKDLKEIAEEIDYSYGRVKHMHLEALDTFAEQYELILLA